jgi:AcrR family transcriptional regulator
MSKNEELSRREQLRARRKTQILDGAAQVFERRGFHAATTREIAEAADVSEGSIYNYFDSKEELLVELMNRIGEAQLERMDLTRDQLDEALGQDARHFLRDVFETRQKFVAAHEDVLRAVVSEILINRDFAERYYQQTLLPYAGMLAEHLEARVERGEIRQADTDLLLRLFSSVSTGLLLLLLMGDEFLRNRWRDEEFIATVTDFVLYGLSARSKPGEPESN